MVSGGGSPGSQAPGLSAPEHQTKTTLAIQALRTAILRGDIAEHAPLTVSSIAQMLGMSPTPVREAIRTLQAEGLLRHQPHHTVSVERFSPKDIHDLFQMRADVESQATLRAGLRLTDIDLERLASLHQQMRAAATHEDFDQLNRLNGEWHLLIYSAADNRILLDVIQHLWKRFMWEVNWISPGRALTSIEEHARILAALRAGAAEEAASLVRAHIHSGEESVVAYLAEREAKGGERDV